LDPITFTFSENSNYWQESLLKVIRQNIAGLCQQTFENKPRTNFSTRNFNFSLKVKVMGSNSGYLLRSFLL